MVIGDRIRSKDAQLESFLSLGLPMTAARVAARLRKNGDDVLAKRDRMALLPGRNGNWQVLLLTRQADLQFRFAICQRSDQPPLVNRGNSRIAEAKFCLSGHI